MPRARKHLVCVADTPYYHVTSRCVRRAFLCGRDKHSGKSYDHRRSWIEERIRVLSSLYSISICAYAVMSNHYHLVVKLDPNESNHWSDDEVLQRWTALFRGPLLVQRYCEGEMLSEAEQGTVRSIAAVYRTRLGNLSWFMKCLNEPIARRANAEDQCTGHFWEARFYSQALCTESALIAAMVYVDLNPVRAGTAKTPEDSAYTSIRSRLSGSSNSIVSQAIARMLKSEELTHFDASPRPLMPFVDTQASSAKDLALPIRELDYVKLVESTGRMAVRNKRGSIGADTAPILQRLGLSEQQWTDASINFRRHYRNGELRFKQSA